MSAPMRLCDMCRQEAADGRFREVRGWEELRGQGGANKIMARVDTGRRICSVCLDKTKRGIAIDQGALL